ncbi:hypothetical protein [Clostridium sp. BJN0013]|uniref:hypothetical protein n=1 Tax=Clostridium sp. BJN0013 TaxID=3236840 RepID=UPI0034C6B979
MIKEFYSVDNKFASFIAQSRSNYASGQRQRFTIARTIYRTPEMFIFVASLLKAII